MKYVIFISFLLSIITMIIFFQKCWRFSVRPTWRSMAYTTWTTDSTSWIFSSTTHRLPKLSNVSETTTITSKCISNWKRCSKWGLNKWILFIYEAGLFSNFSSFLLSVGTMNGGIPGINTVGHTQPSPSPPGHDPRTSSIQALRMRAKEHVESITKSLQMAGWNYYAVYNKIQDHVPPDKTKGCL